MGAKKQPKQPRIAVRIPKGSDLDQRFEAAIKQTGMDAPTLVLRCVEAAIAYIEEHGEITFPIALTPKSDAAKKKSPAPPAATTRGGSVRLSPTALHGPNEPEGDYPAATPKSKTK